MKKIDVQIDENVLTFFGEFHKIITSENSEVSFSLGPHEYRLSKKIRVENSPTINEGMPYQSTPSELDIKISNHLSKLGIPSGLSGFRYMNTAVKKVLSDENILDGITKILYPEIAKYHQSTPQRVEKSLRHAISVAWDNNSALATSKNYHFFVREGKKYPTNSQFIAEVSRQIKLTLFAS